MILEDINGKFDLILEGYSSLDKKIDKNHQESNEKHAHTAFLLDVLNQKLDGVDAKLTEKIDGVETKLTEKIDGVETKLTEKIDGVETKLIEKIDSVETKLTAKIDSVETQLGEKIDALADDLSAHRRDTELHRGYQVRED
jgi:exonuclease VII large subunit